MSVQPFDIDVSDDQIADLHSRLRSVRMPPPMNVPEWSDGTNAAYLSELLEYWRTDFDWRAQERRLNAFPQFRIDLSGLKIHLIHVRARRPDAIPLLVCHGWPGGINEFEKIIAALSEPASASLPAFHLVIPSMPGYGFSDAPSAPDVANIPFIADLWGDLMRSLGYERFGVQGGDWGAWVTIAMSRRMPQRVIGAHVNYVPARYLPPVDERTASSEEREYFERRRKWVDDENGYGAIQGTKPLTLAYGLSDSPAGLAAWIVEKFWDWSGCLGDIESSFTKDELLTNVSLYWFTNSIYGAMRLYKEARRDLTRTPWDLQKSPVPVAVAQFPREIPFPPRSHVSKFLNIVRWTPMPAGGHFAALEAPAALAADIQRSFSSI